MNYLSFDVGIKNLAYCCLTPEKKITQWGIINLNDNPICCSNLRKKCTKQSSYCLKVDDETQYYCSSHSKKFKKCKKINSYHDIFNISQRCVQKLRNLDLSNIKCVLIENQPALKNPVMKSIQMIIYTFFIMDGVLKESSAIQDVKMINARNKLKVYKGEPIISHKKNKYEQNKHLSIEYTSIMIKDESEEFKTCFTNSFKKDDLADSYLQGIYFIEK